MDFPEPIGSKVLPHHIPGHGTMVRTQMIYVVDDDESVRRALKRLLKSQGFDVRTFASAEEFLGYGDLSGIVILDVKMPGMSGLDLQKRLSSKASSAPIIFISAFEDDDTRLEALSNGAVDFLLKPVDDQTLLRAISAATNRNS